MTLSPMMRRLATMSKKLRRAIALLIIIAVASPLPALYKALVAVPALMVLTLDYDEFNIKMMKEGKQL